MKITLLIISALLASHLSFGQSYSAQFSELPSTPGNSLFWQATDTQPTLKFMTTQNGFIGEVQKGKIFIENDLAYRVERKGTRYFLCNADKVTQLVRHERAYMTLDGTELKREKNGTGDKIRIVHPDGTVIAEGKIRSKILGDHTLSLQVQEDHPYGQEIAAMLSIDLLEELRDRGTYIQRGYTASLDK